MIETLIIIGLALYFLPTIVGGMLGVPRLGVIFLVNLFLGWTIAGWVVAGLWVWQRTVGRPDYALDRDRRYRIVRH